MSSISRVSLVVLMTALMIFAFGSYSFASENVDNNVISVSGNGVVKVAPNVAEINFSVITEAKEATTAQMQNTKLLNQVINALENLKKKKKDIITSGYNLQPKYSYEENKAPTINGYEVRNEIQVTVRNTQKVGNVIDVAVSNGINQVQSIRFYVEGNIYQKIKALRLAIEEARAKAEVIATALGKEITGVKSASGSWYDLAPQPIYYEKLMLERQDSATTTPVNPGIAEIKANANIEYIMD